MLEFGRTRANMVVERAEMVVQSRIKIHGRTDKTQIFYNATYIVASVCDAKQIFVTPLNLR